MSPEDASGLPFVPSVAMAVAVVALVAMLLGIIEMWSVLVAVPLTVLATVMDLRGSLLAGWALSAAGVAVLLLGIAG